MTSAHPRHRQAPQTDAQRAFARAEADYQRLRKAYLELARGEDNEVALAMVGADMERASASLQSLSGLRELPFTHQPTRVVRREARRPVPESA